MLRLSAGFLALTAAPLTWAQCESPAPDAEVSTLAVSTTISPLASPSRDPLSERAMAHFEAGKRLSQEGKKAEARAEFDQAIDTLLSAAASTPDRERIEKQIEDLTDRIYRLDVEALDSGDLDKPAFEKAPMDDIRELSFPVDPGLKPKAQAEVKLTQSELPLVMNDAVLSFVNYFSSERGQRTLIAGMKRAGRYKAMISRVLAEEKVPQELIFLAQAESGFAARAVSYMAAVGMWQFIMYRGQEYGLKQSAWHDDRLDPEKATRAAARHLRDLHNQFGDWHLALAAYNCGPGCVDAAVRRTGYADYWELRARNALPRETANYVPIILALTIVSKNLKDYGIAPVEADEPYEYETLPMEANTSLQLLADASDTPLTVLQELNPSFTKNVIPQGEVARVPMGSKDEIAATLPQVPADKRMLWRVHRVQSGETLDSVVRSYRTSAQQVQQANSLATPADLDAGDWLVVPVNPEPPKPVYRYYWVKGRRVLAAVGQKPVQPVRTAIAKATPTRGKVQTSTLRAAAPKATTAGRPSLAKQTVYASHRR